MPQPFDIVLLRFPFTDLSGAKLRPVLVLTRPNGRGDFVAVQVTSQVNHEVQVVIDNTDFALGGLPKPSIVRPDKIFTLNQDLIARRVGRVNDDAFSRILTAVCQYLSCKR
jgi:mRNA interferase MazF